VSGIFGDRSEWHALVQRNNAISEIDLTAQIFYRLIQDGKAEYTLLEGVVSRIQSLMQVKGAENTGVATLVDIATVIRAFKADYVLKAWNKDTSNKQMVGIVEAIISVFDQGSNFRDNTRFFYDGVMEKVKALERNGDDCFVSVILCVQGSYSRESRR
jgi:hypothetical protein